VDRVEHHVSGGARPHVGRAHRGRGVHARYTGRISEDGRYIEGQWEFSEDGITWKVDFDLEYTKVR
jgi:hypothetical protein